MSDKLNFGKIHRKVTFSEGTVF